MKDLNRSKSSLFKRFIFSYVIILLIPLLLLGTLIYNNLIGALSNQAKNATLTMLSQALDVMDMRMKELHYISVQLPRNPNVMPVLYSGDINNISPYQYYKLREELKNYRATNAFIDNIAIYLRNSDMIVNADSKYSTATFFNNIYQYKQISSSSMNYMINTVQNLTIRPAEQVYIDSTTKSIITYLQPIPVSDTFYRATLMITISADSINGLITDVLGSYKGDVYILDREGGVITSVIHSDGLTQSISKVSLLGEDSSSAYLKDIGGQNMLVSYVKSGASDWSIVAIMPSYQILSEVNKILFLSLLIILLAGGIGVALAYYFSYNNYRPIRKIADMFHGSPISERFVNKAYTNELDMISDMLTDTISHDEALQQRLEQQMPIIKTDFIIRLMKGDFPSSTAMREMADFLGFDLHRGPFAVMIFNIDDYDNFAETNSEPMQNIWRLTIINTIEELCNVFGHGYTAVSADNKVAMLIDFDGREMDYRQAMAELGENARLLLAQRFDFTLTIGIGSVYSMLVDVPKSYMEACMAVDYKIINGKDSVIMFDQISPKDDECYYYSIQQENQILDCLKVGNFDGIQQVLSDVIKNISEKPISIAIARCLYFDIINTAMKALAELRPEDYNDVVQNGQLLPNILHCETLEEVYGQTVVFYRNVCERIKAYKENKIADFEEQILQYLEEHYYDKDLSLTSLADKFAVTPSYLSRFFKNHIGCSFIKYLHGIRLGKAKQMLLSYDHTIADIADNVGYIDSHSFIRAFKKYENMTPGQYRELYGINDSKI